MLTVVELLITAAIVIYVVLDPPERWPRNERREREWPERVGSWELDTLIHVTPTGDELELPLTDGWDADSILRTLEHIEAL
jgi:hypothetical protein